MDRELAVLINISENKNISQRQLAKNLDVSLGTVNSLIQQMQQNKWIIVDTSNPKCIEYSITNIGAQVKAEKNYDWIITCYHTIRKTKQNIKRIILRQIANETFNFYLYGKENEIYKIVKMCLIEIRRKHNIRFQKLHDIKQIDSGEQFCILFWEVNEEIDKGLNSIYIL